MESTALPIVAYLATILALLMGFFFFKSRRKDGTNDNADSAAAATTTTSSSFPANGSRRNDKLRVIFDLDECLVHVDKTGTIRPASMHEGLETFILLMRPNLFKYQVYLRPGWKDLMLFLAEHKHQYEAHIFTASEPNYAKPIVAELERRIKLHNPSIQSPVFTHCWFRDSCKRRTYSNHSFTYKDLSLLNTKSSKDLKRTVLIDDDPTNFTDNPHNGIPIKPFLGRDPWDDSLEFVVKLLQQLEPAKDVKPILRERFGILDRMKLAQERYPKFIPSQWEFVMRTVPAL